MNINDQNNQQGIPQNGQPDNTPTAPPEIPAANMPDIPQNDTQNLSQTSPQIAQPEIPQTAVPDIPQNNDFSQPDVNNIQQNVSQGVSETNFRNAPSADTQNIPQENIQSNAQNPDHNNINVPPSVHHNNFQGNPQGIPYTNPQGGVHGGQFSGYGGIPQNGSNFPNQGYYTRPAGQPYAPQYYVYGNPGMNSKPSGSKGKIALISCITAAVIIIFGIIIFAATSGIRTVSDKDQPPPDSSRVESSFGESKDIKEAPGTGADINGPQISAAETPEHTSSETAVAMNVYQKAAESVVCITSYNKKKDYITSATGEGSGIIITEDGYIATNSHVVDDSKKTGVMVCLHNEEQYLGTIIGIDKKTDLAVIKIDASGLKPAEFADSDKLRIGELSFALGNPGGSEFANSLTKGTVSAVNRLLSGSGYVRYIQTDAAINPGNSGGALLNEFGQVIGMNTAKLVATEYEGMGFAIPSNTVIEIINKLIKYGYVNDRGTIGVEGKTCNLYMSKVNNVPQGMLITKIDKDGPVGKTSAKANDIITEINGVKVESTSDLVTELKKYKPDDTITLKLFRPAADKSSKAYSFDISVKLKADTGS